MSWLKENIITLVLLIVSGALAWGGLSSRVDAVDDRTKNLEKKFSEYPSKDYFEEKFNHTNENIDKLDAALKYHLERNNL